MALIFFRTTTEAHQMQNKRLKTLDRSKSHLWIVGGGIAGMAAAEESDRVEEDVPTDMMDELRAMIIPQI